MSEVETKMWNVTDDTQYKIHKILFYTLLWQTTINPKPWAIYTPSSSSHVLCLSEYFVFFLQHSQYTRARLYFKTLLPYNTCTRLTSCWSWPILKYLKYINFNHILYDVIPAEKKIKPITMLVNFFKVKTNVVVSNSITAGYESVRLNPHIS